MPIDNDTRIKLAQLPALKHEIWNNLNRATDIIEYNIAPLEVPSTLTAPTEGALFDINHTPVYKGKGNPGATVTIEQGLLTGGWDRVGTTTVDDSGSWSFTGLKLPPGKREARATQSNGGTGFARNPFTVTDVAVTPVTLISPANGGSLDEGSSTVYGGRGTPGALITIQQGKPSSAWYHVGKALVDTNGVWSHIGLALPVGIREARALQGTDDTASNKSTFTVTPMIAIPVTLTSPAEGIVFDVNHRPAYSGRGTPGAQIIVEQGQLTGPWYKAGEAVVDSNGQWSCIGTKLPTGNREARATQSSDGTVSTRNRFQVMQLVEAPVTLISPANGDSFDESCLTLYHGRGTPGALITIQQGKPGSVWYHVRRVLVDTNGTWCHIGHSLPASIREARALQDTDGTISKKSTFTVTPVAETPVTLTFPAQCASFEDSHVPVYAGRGTPGALIVIVQGRTGQAWRAVGVTRVNTSGDWSFTGHALTAGERKARATQYVKGVASVVTNTFSIVP